MNQFRIFHYYSRLQSFYGVRTNYDWRKLNLICAYLQLLRDELPCFSDVDDCLCEDDIVEILDELYDCQKIISEKPFNWDKELDLVDNWDDYARTGDRRVINSRAAVSGVRVAILEQMLIQARKGSDFAEKNQTVKQIAYIKSGKFVPSKWQLRPLYPNVIYTGRINGSSKLDLLSRYSLGS